MPGERTIPFSGQHVQIAYLAAHPGTTKKRDQRALRPLAAPAGSAFSARIDIQKEKVGI